MKKNFRIIVIALALFIAGSANAQIINTIAGNGTAGFSGDGGSATAAELNSCLGVCLDGAGNLYISDEANYVIRKLSPSGIITTIAGTPGTPGYTGDGGAATAATFNNIYGLAFDNISGNLYLSDGMDNVVRMINPSGIITTVAGNGTSGYSGDGGLATAAQLYGPQGLGVDGSGNLYIADDGNSVVRMLTPGGYISTVVGNHTFGYSGDGGTAMSAELGYTVGLAVDAAGDIFVSDPWYNVVRKVDLAGIISTVAGNGTGGYTGDGGPATNAKLASPANLAVDGSGDLFISHGGFGVIRKVNATGTISTYAGTGTAGYSGDGGPATAAQLNSQNMGLAIDGANNLFIGDLLNNRVREVTIDSSVHSCIDSSYLTISSTEKHGVCNYTATANVITTNEVLGYTWSGVGPAVIHHSHASSDNYTFSLPAGGSATISVIINVVDTNYTDTTGAACCQAVLSKNVTCPLEGDRLAPSGIITTPVKDELISIFPNPTNDAVTVTSSQGNINTLQVIDVNGKVLADYKYSQTQRVEVSLEKLPPGAYLLRVNNTTSKVVSKMK